MRDVPASAMMRARSVMSIAAVMLVVLAAPLIVRAQEPPLAVSIVSVSDADYPQVKAVVSIDDSSGVPLQVTAADIEVTLDGKPAPVIAADLASSQQTPIDILFVMDTSGSMQGEPLARAKEAAKAFVAGLDANDRVAVVSFGDEVRLVQDYTVDRALATAAIDSLVALGNTALYQATAVGAVKIGSSTASRRAVIMLSDGADFGGKSIATREEALAAAASAGAPVFAIAEGSDLDREYLRQLADMTKGRYLEAPNPADLGALYASIGHLLRSQYVVTFDASAVTGTAEVPLQIAVRAGERSGIAAAAYRPSIDHSPPLVRVEGLAGGETLDEPRTVTVVAEGGAAVTRVVFRVDGVIAQEATAPPYAFTFDPAGFAGGAHTLTVDVAAGAQVVETSVTFASTAAQPAAVRRELPILALAGGAGAVLLLIAIAAFVMVVVRRRGQDAGGAGAAAAELLKPWAGSKSDRVAALMGRSEDVLTEQEAIGEALGILIARQGVDLGSEYPVGGLPVSIGSGGRCGVLIDDPDLPTEAARTWIRNGRLMLHRKPRITDIATEGIAAGGWEILEPGETFEIAGHVYEFRLLPEAAPDRAGDSDPVPNVLRDPDVPRRAAEAGPLPFAPGGAEAQQPRLTELMPHDSRPAPGEDDAELRAS